MGYACRYLAPGCCAKGLAAAVSLAFAGLPQQGGLAQRAAAVS